MRKLLLAVIILSLHFAAGAQSNLDVYHYRYTISLNDENDSITAEAGIFFTIPAGATSARFDLTGITPKGQGMKVLSVKALYGWPGEINIKNASFSQTADKVIIPLEKDMVHGDTASVIIQYKGIPADGLIISKNKFGNRTFFGDNWPDRAHNWLPCHDDPADKAGVEFLITAPSHYQVVANGVQIEETNLLGNKKITHWYEKVPISPKVMVIGVADFAVNLSGFVNDCIPVYSWVYPEEKEKGFYDYAQATGILEFYISHIGPYAYKKLANVESKTRFGGLENANTIFYAENSIDGNRTDEDLLAHEIAHQWFGNMATEKSFAHLWLSEGFASYLTILYMENKYGIDTATAQLREDRARVISYNQGKSKTVIDTTHNYMALLNPNSYQKGSWILHMLRSQLGDSVFWKCLQTYYATYAGKTADSDDLRRVFEAVSGKDLQRFFTQWLTKPGVPNLDMTWTYDDKKKVVSLTVKQLQDDVFSFPLTMAFVSPSGSGFFRKIQVDKKEETFSLAAPEKPATLSADPLTQLLFKGSVKEGAAGQ